MLCLFRGKSTIKSFGTYHMHQSLFNSSILLTVFHTESYSASAGFFTRSISNQKSLPWPTLLFTP